MSSSDPSRRTFLRATGVGLSAFWLQLGRVRQSFAEELDGLPKPPTGATLPELAGQYTLDEGLTYLNHASIGTIPRAVQQAHRGYLAACESNPWLHMWGDAWLEPRENVRESAAGLLGCHVDEVSFSHNTTETFNLLANGLPLAAGDEVLFSPLNHSGAAVCWHHAAETRGYTVRQFDFPVLEVAGLTADDVIALYSQAIGPKTRVLVLPHIDNTVGLRHPVRAIADAARQRGVKWIAVDAAQSVGMIPVDVKELGADVVATSAHKWLQAPKGLGLAYIRRDIQPALRPMWVTWGQRSWSESARAYEDYGTRNLAEVITLGNAMTFQNRLGNAREAHHRKLWRMTMDRVDQEPTLTWHSPRTWDLSAALYSIGLKGTPSPDVFQRLFRKYGFVFRPFTSHGLNAVRVSPNTLNTADQVDRLIDFLV